MYKDKRVTVLLLAAGSSERMGFDKLFHLIDGVEVFRLSFNKLDKHPYIDEIIVVAGDNIDKIRALLEHHPPQKDYQVVAGGATRAASVGEGLDSAKDADLLVIHDAARPFVSNRVISRTIEKASQTGAAAPAVDVKDTIKKIDGNKIDHTVARDAIKAVQTPQVFDYAKYTAAYRHLDPTEYDKTTDDCQVMEKAGHAVHLVTGEEKNVKLTTMEDLPVEAVKRFSLPRVGFGYDIHKFCDDRPLFLGGIEIPHDQGLAGHSDADVLLHALCDALLGAAALGDIGMHYPDSDELYKDASSVDLLQNTLKLVYDEGLTVGNIDATILCEEPKLGPYRQQIRHNLSRELGLSSSFISVKATTEEGLGATGTRQGIAAYCVVSLRVL